MKHSTISDDQIRAATGKDWAEWVQILNAWQARRKNLVLVSRYLMRHYELSRYWAQVIAIYYNWGKPSGVG
jgi:hypothetical protein